MADPLDVEDALIASLAGLGLRQVPGLQGDRLHLPRRDENLLRAYQLGTVLKERSTAQGANISGTKNQKWCFSLARKKGKPMESMALDKRITSSSIFNTTPETSKNSKLSRLTANYRVEL